MATAASRADEVSEPNHEGAEAPATLLRTEAELRVALPELEQAPRIALDIESNGLFKYRASLCTMQLATPERAFVVDTMVVPVEPLRWLLGPEGPRKIVHDVAFDARILAEAGLVLAHVLDTSLAARMLGRTATGLASLLGELGVVVDKKLQHHDWTERPIRPLQLAYLANDVIHLGALADRLWSEVETLGIAAEIEEETRYRLEQATTSATMADQRPPWIRLKGVDRLPKEELPVLRRLAELREAKARALDVPPYKVLGPDVLFAVAKARPRTMEELTAVKGATNGSRARSLARAMLDAVARGVTEQVPADELTMLERPRLASAIARARRAREQRLASWRKAEAKRRGVDEQVVLPGHCLQDLADIGDASNDAIASVPGLGAFRMAAHGEALLAALREPAAPEEVAPPEAVP